jgi:hypothetical protein
MEANGSRPIPQRAAFGNDPVHRHWTPLASMVYAEVLTQEDIMRYAGLATTLAAVALGACGAPRAEQASEPKFNSDVIVGHEDITRFAIDYANAELERRGDSFRFPQERFGVRGRNSGNPLVRGNWASDAAEKVLEVSLHEFYGIPDDDVLAEDGAFMDIHTLRNYRYRADGTLEVASARQTCLDAQARVVAAVNEALRSWGTDDYRALFFLGHATHTIQDSYSKAHTRRTSDFRLFLDICTWAVSVDGVCQHQDWLGTEFDPNDYIWKNPITCPVTRRWDCLKPEAQAAAVATKDLMLATLAAREQGLDQDTTDRLVRDTLETSGALPCNAF